MAPRTILASLVALLAHATPGVADAQSSSDPTDPLADPGCTQPVQPGADSTLTIGDGRALPADTVRVPSHIDAAELTSAEWGVIPSLYLDSWLQFDAGNFVWKRSRVAPDDGALDAGTVNWVGVDDGGQQLPSARGGGSAVALYTYTIKSSTEKTKKVKRFAEASVAAEANAQWLGGAANAKVTGAVDTESDFDHNISEKVDITISIKCASYLVAGNPNPDPAILYFGPDTVKRDLPLPIKDAEGKPKTIKWNPIAVDAAFSADNAATNGNAIACWYKYRGQIEKGELSNTSWETKKGASAEVGVSNGWRVWKFTADVSVEGKAAGQWHDMDRTEFSKDATGTWAINGDSYWTFPAPPTQKQRDDFQKPCKDNNDAGACAQWDNIKAAYMSEIMKVKGEDGATDYGPNYRMAEWQGAMLTGSFRKVGDWLDGTSFFDLAELQQIGSDCTVEGVMRTEARFAAGNPVGRDVINGLKGDRCSVVDVAKPIDTTAKVGRIEHAVLERANTTRSDFAWLRKTGLFAGNMYWCSHKDWDWDLLPGANGKFPYWFFAHKLIKQLRDAGRSEGTDWACWGCYKVNGQSCDN